MSSDATGGPRDADGEPSDDGAPDDDRSDTGARAAPSAQPDDRSDTPEAPAQPARPADPTAAPGSPAPLARSEDPTAAPGSPAQLARPEDLMAAPADVARGNEKVAPAEPVHRQSLQRAPVESVEASIAAAVLAAPIVRPQLDSAQPASQPVARPRRRGWLRIAGRVVEAGTIVLGLGALVLWCSVPDPRRLANENPSSTAFIDLRRSQAGEVGRALHLEWQWRPIGKISRYLRAAIIYAEDYNFYRHDGVDWGAIEDAVEANWDRGSFSIGGSTITQQLAKNLYLSPSRSVLRKLRELLIAYRLEDRLTKQRILELYLNVVEWGDGVFGAEAAARHWFGHSAQNLSPAEAARLAIALPNPIARAPNISSGELTRKAVRIIHLLRLQGLLDPAQERLALDQVGAPDEKVLPARPTSPDTGQPDTGQPDTGQPDTGRPDTGRPDTGEPETGRPDTGRPDTGQPDTGRPDTGQPDTGRPDTGRPDTGRPDTGQPDTGRPDTGRPDTGRPDTGRPDTGRPDTGRPDTGQPDTGQPN